MNTATETPAFLIARTIRDNDLNSAATAIVAMLKSATPAFIAEVGELAPLLGYDSSLVLDVALVEATVAAGEGAGRCSVGSRRRLAHLARFEALCAAHDCYLAVEKARAA